MNEHYDHLGHVTTFQGVSTPNLALIGQTVSVKKMFGNNGHKHVFSPRAGTDNPSGNSFS